MLISDWSSDVCSSDLLLETQDGGQTWNSVDSHGFDEDELHLNSIGKLKNDDLMMAVEQGLIAISTDGGVTWTKQASQYEGPYFGLLPPGKKAAPIYGLPGPVYHRGAHPRDKKLEKQGEGDKW